VVALVRAASLGEWQVRRKVGILLAVSLAYAFGSQLAFLWFNANGVNASFFPSAGVTLAALALTRVRDWPAVLAGAALAEVALDLHHGIGLGPTAGYTLANLIEPTVGALLLRRFVPRLDLVRTADLIRFVGCAVIGGPAVGAAVGATNNSLLDGGDDWARFAGQWWIGDGLGVLVVAGAVLALHSNGRALLTGLPEALVLPVATVSLTGAVFWLEQLPLGLVPVIVLIWTAFRVGTAGVAMAGTGMAFVAAQATATGHTFWDSFGVSPATGLVYLQLLLAVIIVTSLVLSAEIRHRESALLALGRTENARQEARRAAARATVLAEMTATLLGMEDEDAIEACVTGQGLRPLYPACGTTLSLRRTTEEAGLGILPADAEHREAPAVSDVLRHPDLASLEARQALLVRARTNDDGTPAGARAYLRVRTLPFDKVLVVELPGVEEIDPSDRAYLIDLASRFEQALEACRLRRAERAALERTMVLQRVSGGLAAAATSQDVAGVVTDATLEAFGARSVALLLEDDRGDAQILAVSGYDSSERAQVAAILHENARTASMEAYRNGGIASFESRTEGLAKFPDLVKMPVRFEAAFAIGLDAKNGRRGALAWAFAEERRFDTAFVSLARAIAAQCALALERSRLSDVEHRFVMQLQRTMLPDEIAAPPGVAIAVRYAASQQELGVGGDWYDVVDHGDSCLTVVVGDVVGRGFTAAVAMTQLRSAARALLHATNGPVELLEGLDRFCEPIEGARYSTACVAQFDLSTGRMRYAAAAHPPPFLVDGGRVESLASGRSTPLCAGLGQPRPEATALLPPGATIVFYTDGLVERRGESIDDGLARLAGVLSDNAVLAPGALADAVLEALLAGAEAPDDAALVVLRLPDVPAQLSRRVPAEATLLRSLRGDLRLWLEGNGVGSNAAAEIVLACGEALSNAVEHAYAGATAGEIELHASRDGDVLRFEIRDRGTWRPEDHLPHRGWGRSIMRALADQVDAASDESGTTVTMTRRLVGGSAQPS
jgi:serine phosphatase RsbU (regulator of sigma subunit)/integral membrane sensor domain MASE1/anti-sigma regulatory factor (Ser/Thr protein kinase)